MMKRITFTSLAVCLLMSACGAGATAAPTTDPQNIVNTAQAAAFTMIAGTQAAMPTATFTETPTPITQPTDTPIPLPTLAVTLPPTSALPTLASGAPTSDDPCHHPLAPNAPGNPAVIRIKNKTNGPINGILKIWKKTEFGECGYQTVNIAAHESATYYTITGYYYVSVYTSKAMAYGEAIISDDHLIDFEVYDDWVKVIYP